MQIRPVTIFEIPYYAMQSLCLFPLYPMQLLKRSRFVLVSVATGLFLKIGKSPIKVIIGLLTCSLKNRTYDFYKGRETD